MHIKINDLTNPKIVALLSEHLDEMHATSPVESVHAFNIEALKQSNIIFYSAWHDEQLLGCAAIKHHSETFAEIKSMRTQKGARKQGVASSLLQHIIGYALAKKYRSLSLETGTQDYFLPAHSLYRKFGFTYCLPFGSYKQDPNSAFMTLSLSELRESE